MLTNWVAISRWKSGGGGEGQQKVIHSSPLFSCNCKFITRKSFILHGPIAMRFCNCAHEKSFVSMKWSFSEAPPLPPLMPLRSPPTLPTLNNEITHQRRWLASLSVVIAIYHRRRRRRCRRRLRPMTRRRMRFQASQRSFRASALAPLAPLLVSAHNQRGEEEGTPAEATATTTRGNLIYATRHVTADLVPCQSLCLSNHLPLFRCSAQLFARLGRRRWMRPCGASVAQLQKLDSQSQCNNYICPGTHLDLRDPPFSQATSDLRLMLLIEQLPLKLLLRC